MNDKIALLIIYLGFLLLSYIVYRFALILNKIWAFALFVLYLLGILYYFELFTQLHQSLREKKIYIDFGHADLGLLMLMGFCYLNAFILFIIVVVKLGGKSES